MKQSLMVIEPHEFEADDFVGGDPAIDFVNTVTGRDAEPRDWLDGYSRLLDWASQTRLLPEKALRALARKALAEPAAAARALGRAKALREALFDILSAIAEGSAPSREALALLREHWIEGARAQDIRYESGRVAPSLRNDDADLDVIAAIVAWRTVALVLPSPADRLRLCDGPNCSWLFIDRSKAGRRRWCDMADCGNTAKSRRFQARRRRG
jgi:predicted RNA-binding Zn ribbon-like protein